MKTTFTPGPWRTDSSPYEDNGDLLIMSGPCHDSELIAVLPTDLVERQKVEANARLIAAAPELLEALRLAWSEDCFLNDATRQIVRQALAKAKA